MLIPDRTIERVIAYRRWLCSALEEGKSRIYSHELAALEGVTAAQVRRDLMTIGFAGSPSRGYEVAGLIDKIGRLLDPSPNEGFALVGVGHLGRAILARFREHRPQLAIVAAFDNDPEKVGRVLHGVRCYGVNELPRVASERAIRLGVVTVPAAAAQEVTRALTDCGVRAILNFAPVRLRVPAGVYVENVDIATRLAKAAFFARQLAGAMEDHT